MNHEASAGVGPTLETERLVLHPLSAGDADALRRIANEPEVRCHLWDDEPVGEATIRDVIAQSEGMFSEGGVGLFGVRMLSSERLLGFCGLVCLEGRQSQSSATS